jgi:dipeptidyl aminopeptidase/acylaminoacyl peptidase
VLIIHGMEDRQVPAGHARQLYAAAGEPKELWIVPGAGHTGSLAQAPEEYAARVVAFFDRWLVSEEMGESGQPVT